MRARHSGFMVTIRVQAPAHALPYSVSQQELIIGPDGTSADDVRRVAINCITSGRAELHPVNLDGLLYYADSLHLASATLFRVEQVLRVDPASLHSMTAYIPPHPYEELLEMGSLPDVAAVAA